MITQFLFVVSYYFFLFNRVVLIQKWGISVITVLVISLDTLILHHNSFLYKRRRFRLKINRVHLLEWHMVITSIWSSTFTFSISRKLVYIIYITFIPRNILIILRRLWNLKIPSKRIANLLPWVLILIDTWISVKVRFVFPSEESESISRRSMEAILMISCFKSVLYLLNFAQSIVTIVVWMIILISVYICGLTVLQISLSLDRLRLKRYLHAIAHFLLIVAVEIRIHNNHSPLDSIHIFFHLNGSAADFTPLPMIRWLKWHSADSRIKVSFVHRVIYLRTIINASWRVRAIGTVNVLIALSTLHKQIVFLNFVFFIFC